MRKAVHFQVIEHNEEPIMFVLLEDGEIIAENLTETLRRARWDAEFPEACHAVISEADDYEC